MIDFHTSEGDCAMEQQLRQVIQLCFVSNMDSTVLATYAIIYHNIPPPPINALHMHSSLKS